jgi:hypothetical protein
LLFRSWLGCTMTTARWPKAGKTESARKREFFFLE